MSLLFCNKKPRRVCGIALVRGIRFQFLFLIGIFGLSYPAVPQLGLSGSSVVTPATGARPRETNVNLRDCICLCTVKLKLPLVENFAQIMLRKLYYGFEDRLSR